LGWYKEKRKYPGIKTKYILFLTGTPILNRPIEAYYLLNVLDPQRFNNFYHFTRRYGGWKGDAPRNLKELHERTKDVVIRRLRKNVMAELPGKQRNDLYIRMDKDERSAYDDLLNELFRGWRFQGKATVSTMPKIQGFLTEMKLPRVQEIIDEYLDNDRSILIFSVYIDPLKKLKEKYGDQAELFYGATSAMERRAIIKRLREGKSKVGLFGLAAGGMAVDGLQYIMDTVIFLNQDWVPGVHEQAEDRTDRIGQTEKVQVFYMLCENTIDEDMRILLAEKQKVIDTVADGELISLARSKSTFKAFVRRLSLQMGEDFTS
jgi:SNF2 family DNA or RNA helicase